MPNYEFKRNRMSDDDELKDFYYTDPSAFKSGEARNIKNLAKNIKYKYVKPITKDSRFELDIGRNKGRVTFKKNF